MKPTVLMVMHMATDSRPFTGAWIETVVVATASTGEQVAPSRGRGLKPTKQPRMIALRIVAPSRGRGLKPWARGPSWHVVGRPFTGAWIETNNG